MFYIPLSVYAVETVIKIHHPFTELLNMFPRQVGAFQTQFIWYQIESQKRNILLWGP